MAQFARPNADNSDGSFTKSPGGGNVDLWQAIDELVADDADYIVATDWAGIGGNQTAACTIDVSDVSDPAVDTNHFYRVRYNIPVYDGGGWVFQVILKCNGTTITNFQAANSVPTAGWQDQLITVLNIEAALITDYSGLQLQFVITDDDVTASTVELRVSWAEVEVPNAPSFGKMMCRGS